MRSVTKYAIIIIYYLNQSFQNKEDVNNLNLLSLIAFSSFLCFMYIGIEVIYTDWKSDLNRTFFAVFSCLAIWAFAYTFYYSAENKETAMFWHRIGAIGGSCFVSFALHFFLILINNKKILKNPFTYMIIYIPPSVFITRYFLGLHTPFAIDLIKRNSTFGWTYLSPINSPWLWGFVLYLTIFFSVGLFLLYNWGKKSNSIREKKQAQIFIVSDLVWLTIGIVSEIIMPVLKVNFPAIAIDLSILWALSIKYAISKYALIPMTNSTAADLILDTITDPVVLVDSNSKIVSFNRATTALLNCKNEDIKWQKLDKILANSSFDQVELNELCSKKLVQNKEITLIDSSSNLIFTQYSASLMEHRLSGIVGTVFVFHDITKLKLLEQALRESEAKYKLIAEEMKNIAHYDSLTNLPNRRLFLEHLNEIVNLSKTEDLSFGIMFIDLDGFKNINDELGHNVGDTLLVQVAERLQESIGEFGIVARIGGDEFTVLLSKIESKNDIEIIAETILLNLEQPFSIQGHICSISASIGISIFPDDGNEIENLLNYADQAMYYIKNNNKGDYRFFDEAKST